MFELRLSSLEGNGRGERMGGESLFLEEYFPRLHGTHNPGRCYQAAHGHKDDNNVYLGFSFSGRSQFKGMNAAQCESYYASCR